MASSDLGYIAGGLLSGVGAGLIQDGIERRREALHMLDLQFRREEGALGRQATASEGALGRAATASEGLLGRTATAEQNKLTREATAAEHALTRTSAEKIAQGKIESEAELRKAQAEEARGKAEYYKSGGGRSAGPIVNIDPVTFKILRPGEAAEDGGEGVPTKATDALRMQGVLNNAANAKAIAEIKEIGAGERTAATIAGRKDVAEAQIKGQAEAAAARGASAEVVAGILADSRIEAARERGASAKEIADINAEAKKEAAEIGGRATVKAAEIGAEARVEASGTKPRIELDAETQAALRRQAQSLAKAELPTFRFGFGSEGSAAYRAAKRKNPDLTDERFLIDRTEDIFEELVARRSRSPQEFIPSRGLGNPRVAAPTPAPPPVTPVQPAPATPPAPGAVDIYAAAKAALRRGVPRAAVEKRLIELGGDPKKL